MNSGQQSTTGTELATESLKSASRSRVSLLAQLFASNAFYKEVALEPYSLKLQEKSRADSQELLPVECLLEEGIVWSTLHVKHSDDTWKKIGGLKKSDARAMKEGIEQQIFRTKAIVENMKSEAGLFSNTVAWIEKCKSGSQWVANRHLQALQPFLNKYSEFWGVPVSLYERSGHSETYLSVNSLALDWGRFREESNLVFRIQEMARQQEFFASLPVPPTLEQSEATICDEDAVLVVASAGSGKTTLLLGKVQYLLMRGLADPDDVLVLAFNRSAKETLAKRLIEQTGKTFAVHTFHSFGMEVLANATGKRPSLANFAESDSMLRAHVQDLLDVVLRKRLCQQATMRFFIEFLRPHQSAFDFSTKGEYFEYLRNQQLVTYQGDEVKSLEEVTIANWLFMNGIKYEYERQYPHDTATVEFGQYKPDFYLSDYDIYLEHFALDESGRAPACFENYTDSVAWKRHLHGHHKTKLLETYSYQAERGVLQEALSKMLISSGVRFAPIPQDVALEMLLSDKKRVTELAELMKTFLHLFKGKNETIDALRSRLDLSMRNAARTNAFLDLFEHFYAAYEESLKASNSIDFDDMINLSTKAIEGKKYERNFKYLLVDEFQDISLGRANLLRGIKQNLAVEQLFAVGDDWQAINRFAGGDVTVMTRFEKVFGFCSTYKLTKTHRFNNKVNDVASAFILKNPEQLNKKVEPLKYVNDDQVVLIKPEKTGYQTLLDILREINLETTRTAGTEVLILARYKKILDEYKPNIPGLFRIKQEHSANARNDRTLWRYKTNNQDFSKLSLVFSTVHASKGQESDYVIVLELVGGTTGMRGTGFPSEAVDDPIFGYVLAASDDFPNAEERRLFYVALTRTKNKVYLVADSKRPSKFTKELESDGYKLDRRGFNGQRERLCPMCETSKLVLRKGPKGQFIGCSNYPLCTYTAQICSVCGRGVLTNTGAGVVCDNKACSYKAKSCPKCRKGFLVRRNSSSSAFLGCSNYFKDGCTYTENTPNIDEPESPQNGISS